MQRQVVVDDIDPQIQYIGNDWFQDHGSQDNVGNLGPTYMKTSHGTQSSGSLSFSFNGSSVSVFGTIHLVQIHNKWWTGPKIKCFVDGISVESTEPLKFPENNSHLCGQNLLNDGPHTVTVNITTTGNTFYLDYLIYAPSPKMTFNETVLLVDYSDPAFFFSAGWDVVKDTATVTNVIGSQVKFDFTGTSISWVGYVPHELSHAAASGSFIIDDSKPINFTLKGLSPNETTSQYNQIFFVTPDLAPGPHSLIVTYNGGNGPSTPLTLDYLYITNTSNPQPVMVGATSSVTPLVTPLSPSASGGFQGDTGGHRLSGTLPVGTIVGGIIGGLAFIFLIFLLLWWRRRGAETKSKYHIGKSGILPGVNPFLSLPPASRNSGNLDKASYPVSPTRRTPNVPLPPSTLDNNPFHATKTTCQPRTIPKGRIRCSWPSVLPVQYQDSGDRLPPPAVIEDIPPQYTFA